MTSRWLIAYCLVVFGAPAWGAEVKVYSTTLVGGRPDVVDGRVKTVVPLYELVGVRAQKIDLQGFDELGVAVDAWGGLSTTGTSGTPGNVGQSDVNFAFIEGQTFNRRLKLRLGRQFMVGGVARAFYFDGLMALYKSQLGLGLSVFAGMPVERRFSNFMRGDFVVGTRAFYAPTFNTEVGASFIHVLQRGAVARQDTGLDARWHPTRALTLSGSVVWSIAAAQLAEFDVGPRWSPTENLEIHFGYRRTAPQLFLPLTSIFTVFADQSRDDAGANATWQVTRTVSLFAEGRALWLNGELGYDASARVAVQPARSPNTTLSATVHKLQVPSNGYLQARLAARHVMPSGLGLSLDLETYSLNHPVRGQKLSFAASASATYTLSKSWFIGATFFGSVTPLFEQRYEAIAKLTWLFPAEGHL